MKKRPSTTDKLSNSERFAFWITQKVGKMTFFYLIFIWTAIWLLWNILAPKTVQFDPAPDFLLWLFISNMIQIFLMPLIIIGQNIQGNKAEIRANEDFQINIKAEQEIKELHQKIDLLIEELRQQKSKSDN